MGAHEDDPAGGVSSIRESPAALPSAASHSGDGDRPRTPDVRSDRPSRAHRDGGRAGCPRCQQVHQARKPCSHRPPTRRRSPIASHHRARRGRQPSPRRHDSDTTETIVTEQTGGGTVGVAGGSVRAVPLPGLRPRHVEPLGNSSCLGQAVQPLVPQRERLSRKDRRGPPGSRLPRTAYLRRWGVHRPDDSDSLRWRSRLAGRGSRSGLGIGP